MDAVEGARAFVSYSPESDCDDRYQCFRAGNSACGIVPLPAEEQYTMVSGTQLTCVLALSVLAFVGVGIGTFGSGGDPALNVTAGGPADEGSPSSPTTTPADRSRLEPTDGSRTVQRPPEATTAPEEPADDGPVSPETTPSAADRTATSTESEPTSTRDSSDSVEIDGGGVDLRTERDGLAIRAAGLLPGDSGSRSLPVRNVGNGSGQLAVTDVRIEDHENSLAEPERAAGDDAAAGELSSALRVRLSVDYADGDREFLAGAADEYVALDSLDRADLTGEEALASGAAATVRLEWKLPLSTGNEVQTDGVDVDADLRLEGR